jgi:hypothetical protein
VEVSYEKLIEFGEKLQCKILPFEVLLYRHQLAYLGHLARREDDQLQKLILRSRLAAGVPIHHTQRASHITNFRKALSAFNISEKGWEDDAEDRDGWRDQVRDDGTNYFMENWLRNRAAVREERHTTEFLKTWRTQLLFDSDEDLLPDEVALNNSTTHRDLDDDEDDEDYVPESGQDDEDDDYDSADYVQEDDEDDDGDDSDDSDYDQESSEDDEDSDDDYSVEGDEDDEDDDEDSDYTARSDEDDDEEDESDEDDEGKGKHNEMKMERSSKQLTSFSAAESRVSREAHDSPYVNCSRRKRTPKHPERSSSGIVKPTDNDFFSLIMTLSFTDNDFLVY